MPVYGTVNRPTPGQPLASNTFTTETLQPLVDNDASIKAIADGHTSAINTINTRETVISAATMAAIASPSNGSVRTLGVLESGVLMPVARMTFQSGVTAALANGVAGVTYVIAADNSGRWVNPAYMSGIQAGGLVATGSSGEALMPGNVSGLPRFKTAVRVTVPIPVTQFVPKRLGQLGAQELDSTNYQVQAEKRLSAIRSQKMASPLMFRTRLPKGSFAGMAMVVRPNTTGVPFPTFPAATLTMDTVLKVKVYEVKNVDQVSGGADMVTYDTDADFANTLTLVWTGAWGTDGGVRNTTSPYSAETYRGVTMRSGVAPASSDVPGAGSAFSCREDREYVVFVEPPTFSGSHATSNYATIGIEPEIYKLEALVDITSLGAT